MYGVFYMEKKVDYGIIRRSDPEYSEYLNEISDPPELLYYRGDLSLLRSTRCVSIVGSRRATAYGKEVVKEIVPQLVRQQLITVSGLAFGIDACVHEETLRAGGKTIGVLGSGIDQITPLSNRALAERMLNSRGLILSEYPPGTPAYANHFPARNRIIAGLSMATIVVEAAQRSGSLITARLAREYNRDVFAVPGSIFSPLSVGTHFLISVGAQPWISCEILMNTLEYTLDSSAAGLTSRPPALSAAEESFLSLFSYEPISLDEMINASQMDVSTVIALTNQLVIKGLILQNEHQHYYRVKQ